MVRARTGTKFTETERAIMEHLSDGQPHAKKEMHKLFCGPTSMTALNSHIARIRTKLPAGQDIVCRVLNRHFCYQQVRLIASAHNGRT